MVNRPDCGIVQEDKTVSKLEGLCREIELLRKDLAEAKKRINFLEERVDSAHQSIFGDPILKVPSCR